VFRGKSSLGEINLPALRTLLPQVRACRICEHALPHGPRPVVQISRTATILIVGQAPGRRVHETGIPFNDPSGDRLRDWMGIDRGIFYDAKRIATLPMGFCYPGTGANGDLPPRPECAPAWREALLANLPKLQLTLVIGHYAQTYHLKNGKQSVTDAVRAWKSYWPQQIPLPHPSPRNQMWVKNNPWFTREVLPALKKRVQALV
jgi:uracil-DNA glycosylase